MWFSPTFVGVIQVRPHCFAPGGAGSLRFLKETHADCVKHRLERHLQGRL